MPAAVTEIGDDAFSECSSLESVELPVSLKKIGGGAFEKCVSLRNVTLNSPNPPSISKSTFKDVVLGSCKFTIPRGCKPLYQNEKQKQWVKIPQLVEKL